jgi:hypothetical protein
MGTEVLIKPDLNIKNHSIMKTVTLCIVLSLVILESCVPIIKLSYGISRPQMESPESLIKFLQKNKYPVGNQYQMKDSSTYVEMMNDTVFHTLLFKTLLFTGDFQLIEMDTNHCQWSGGYAIEHLKKDSVYTFNDRFSIPDIYSVIRPLYDSITPVVITKGEYDFIIVNTWAKFLGKLNERLFSVDESVKLRPDLKLLVINLNMDMQGTWHLNKEQRIELN